MKHFDKENSELLLSLLIYTCISANCTVSILRSIDPIALGNGILILKNESLNKVYKSNLYVVFL